MSKNKNIIWYLNRLKCMSAGEVVYRVNNKLQAELEKRGVGIVRDVPEPSEQYGMPWFSEPCMIEPQIYKQAAEKILSGQYDIFSLKDADIGFPPDWNKDPRTGIKAPMDFGKTLNYRKESIVGDIKYLWEPNRHLELVTLAQAYYLTGDKRYAAGAQQLLCSWFEQCPYPLGVNWTSSLEHSVRLLNWSFAWHLLGGHHSVLFKSQAGQKFKQSWLESIYQHLYFIAGHFSKYSSANNHLLGEYMGLLIGAMTWPLWANCEHWKKIAYDGFLNEALKQNAVDGVNLEQGIWYHHEVADMMLLTATVGKANAVEFPQVFWQRLEAMLEFLAAVMDVGGNVPMIGDSDDAVMVRFSPAPIHVYRSLLATGAVIFGRADFKEKAVDFDDKCKWLLGVDGVEKFTALKKAQTDRSLTRSFPDGGYYILGKGLDTNEEVRLVADAGPLGYLSIAAHGHADALSLTLSIQGNEILIDPGTYAYHTQELWRNYFRGTSAHNTVRIDCLDQSLPAGNFIWLNHAKSNCLSFERGKYRDFWKAEHSGYLRLTDPVNHQRSIVYDKKVNVIKVTDTVSARKKHFAELYWHLSEHCTVQVFEKTIVINNNDTQVSMRMLDSDWCPEVLKGSETPPIGWVSRGFDQKIPTISLRWAGEITGNTVFTTEIKINTLG